jgi:hypothetical protein
MELQRQGRQAALDAVAASDECGPFRVGGVGREDHDGASRAPCGEEGDDEGGPGLDEQGDAVPRTGVVVAEDARLKVATQGGEATVRERDDAAVDGGAARVVIEERVEEGSHVREVVRYRGSSARRRGHCGP